MAKGPRTIEELTEDARNPREMTAQEFKGLGHSLAEFGDISGFVWNSRTGMLVCGHQRRKALIEKYGDRLKIKGWKTAFQSSVIGPARSPTMPRSPAAPSASASPRGKRLLPGCDRRDAPSDIRS